MATPAQEEAMRHLAGKLDMVLQSMYGTKMGFFLTVVPFGDGSPGISDYIANIGRNEAIDMLRTTADPLESNQVMPAAQGQA
ncbi:hypothetical protein [Bowmanella denitrificans]|uniref:hypothetical protein n=1 Tax=Bowmanella denitrificans TaxID=366582 RepID=UPI000C9CDD0C|nr:hypothetical protein [Bowmanella denitrificans]